MILRDGNHLQVMRERPLKTNIQGSIHFIKTLYPVGGFRFLVEWKHHLTGETDNPQEFSYLNIEKIQFQVMNTLIA